MKILWPYEPFSRDSKLDKIGKDIILNYFSNDSVEAVYISSRAEIELTNAFNIPLRYRFSLFPKNLIKKQLDKLNLKNLKIKVIESNFLSTSKITNELVGYAQEKKADLILLASNSKKTIPKFIFGSFAETLIHLSLTDVLVYHQKNVYLNKKPKKMIYAHDFTVKGNKGLLKAVEYAQKWDATLFVLHVPIPVPELSDEEFLFSVEHNIKKCDQLLSKMKIKFKIMNLLEDYSIDELSIDEIILLFARKNKIDLIAMSTQANNLKIVLGGSIARKVLRKSTKPVLIFKT